ncbi:TonB-dependent copper receptor [Pantoea sp. y20]
MALSNSSFHTKKLACIIAFYCAAQANFSNAEGMMTVTATPNGEAGKTFVNTKKKYHAQPVSDGASLLSTQAGFSQIRNGGTNGDPVLRGMFGSRLNILADGGNLQGGCGSRMDSPTSYISPDNYDLVEIVKGPQTVLWGPMASAGTIMFDRVAEYFPEPGMKGSVSFLHGNHGRTDQDVNVAVGDQDGWLRVDANRSVAKDYKSGNGTRVPGLWQKWNAGVAIGLTPGENTLMELALSGGDGKARYASRAMDGSKFQRKSALFKIEQSNLTEHLTKINWRSYYNVTDHVMDNFSLREPPAMKMSSEPGSVVYGTRLSADWEKNDALVTFGADAQQRQHRKKQPQSWKADAEYRQVGLFAEWHETLSENSKAVTGARIDSVHSRDLRQDGHVSRQATLPGVFARYEYTFPNAPVKIWSGVGYTERFPDYWELFSGKAGAASFKQLKSERTTQWDSGIQYQTEALDFWASGWLNRVNDYIMFDYSSKTTRAENIDAWTIGSELGSAWSFAPNWKVQSTLAWVRGDNLSQHSPMPQMPPLEAKVAVTRSINQWDSTLAWRGVASQGRVDKDKGNVTGRDLGRTAGFGVLSWDAYYHVNNRFTVGAGVDNLFNKNYTQHLNGAGNKQFGFSTDQKIPEPGRTGWVNVEYKF